MLSEHFSVYYNEVMGLDKVYSLRIKVISSLKCCLAIQKTMWIVCRFCFPFLWVTYCRHLLQ